MVDAGGLSQWIVNVGRRDARKRVAHLLCEMATRLSSVREGNDHVFDLPITQEQLADATALTPVHVNRTVKSLRDEGLVHWLNRTVRLTDWEALVDLAEFDPAYLQLDLKPEQRMRIVRGS